MFSGNTLIPLIFHSFKIPVFALWERFCVLYGIQSLYKNNHELYLRIKKRDKDGAIEWINTSINDSIKGNKEIYFD